MRLSSILSLLLVSQLLVGCEMLQRPDTGQQQGTAVPDSSPQTDAQGAPGGQVEACPAPVAPVCAEPEVKVVERIIERTYEKMVEVPVAKDKLVLGSVEYFLVEPGGMRLESLVDSGAATSSLGTQELTLFERDGKDWVRFSLTNPVDAAQPVKIELPVRRFVRVARPGFDSQRRPVVDMSLTVGEVTHMVEVNLTERSGFDYVLLIGRNFLKDTAVVDVSRRYVQGDPKLPFAK